MRKRREKETKGETCMYERGREGRKDQMKRPFSLYNRVGPT